MGLHSKEMKKESELHLCCLNVFNVFLYKSNIAKMKPY